MKPTFNDFMVDFETLGLCPARNYAIQMCMVAFNLDTMEIGGHVEFGFDIREPEVRHQCADQATLDWWKRQSKEVMAGIEPLMFDGVPTGVKLNATNRFILDNCDRDKPVRFWSRPATFDFRFASELWQNYQKDFLFHFTNCYDQMSYSVGKLGSRELYESLKPEKPERVHNARIDCYWQLDWLRKVQEYGNANTNVG